MIIIHAFIKVKPEHREAFLAKTKEVTAGTLAEEGVLSYRLYEDAEQPNSFVMLETWKDHQAIQSHQESAHFQRFMADVQVMMSEPTNVSIYAATEQIS